ncbi:hypothetical protein AAFP35_20625 [Gordonia sp. CPCC 206044]|uniref:hypothetical protein n=1 Tax=Gordonia sp. CPCC 206044 TaxID=3140793 RepID=UPI003AF3F0E3
MATETEIRTDDDTTADVDATEQADDTTKQKTTATRTAPVSSRRREKSGRRPRVRTVVTAVVGLVLIAATVFFGYSYFADRDNGDSVSTQTRSEAVGVARDYAIKLSSFDYRDLNKNRDEIDSMSTPDFAKKYGEMVKALGEIVTNGKGEATATVSHSAVESISPEKATVLLFVDQKAKNVVAPDGKVQPYRMLVTLKQSDDHWLVDNVETL